VVVTPTSTHRAVTETAIAAGKAIFCEKPLSISLDEAIAIRRAVRRSGVFFQMGFMRRFDRGFAAAKKRLEEGTIGDAVVFKSTSRDPFRPSVEYADPRSSGGLILDMAIHDIDLARWYMGEVEAVQAIGGLLAYPELGAVGDIDNAVISLIFSSGRLGVVDITRNGIYGYDIMAELLGTKGTLRVGYLRETPLMVMTKGTVAHDTVPYFMERFAEAYTSQLENFARNVLDGREPPITVDDGVEALRVAIAATTAQKTGQRVAITSIVPTVQEEPA
jgi:scyllo-inositol 2-dehydrogenase (NAD+)